MHRKLRIKIVEVSGFYARHGFGLIAVGKFPSPPQVGQVWELEMHSHRITTLKLLEDNNETNKTLKTV